MSGRGQASRGSCSGRGAAVSPAGSWRFERVSPSRRMPFSAGIKPRSRAQPMARNSSRSATARSRLRARVTIRKSRILDLERDGPAGDPLLADPPPDGLADPVELGGERRLVGQILEERVLGADRFPGPVRASPGGGRCRGRDCNNSRRSSRNCGRGTRGSARCRSAPVSMPSRAIFSAVFGPTPWKRLTGSAATKASPLPGGITHRPSGLFWSEASLARNLL